MCRREKKNEKSGLAAEDGRDHRDRWPYLHESPRLCVCVCDGARGGGGSGEGNLLCVTAPPPRPLPPPCLMCVCFSGETAFQLRVRTTFSSLKFVMSLEIKTAAAAAASTKHGELVPDQRPRRGSESRSGAPRFSLYISCARQHTAAVHVVLLWLRVSLRSERRASGSPLSSPTICGTFYCVLCHVESLRWRRICLHLFPVCGPSQRLCCGRR